MRKRAQQLAVSTLLGLFITTAGWGRAEATNPYPHTIPEITLRVFLHRVVHNDPARDVSWNLINGTLMPGLQAAYSGPDAPVSGATCDPAGLPFRVKFIVSGTGDLPEADALSTSCNPSSPYYHADAIDIVFGHFPSGGGSCRPEDPLLGATSSQYLSILVHEIGHSLSLWHTNGEDYVCDTAPPWPGQTNSDCSWTNQGTPLPGTPLWDHLNWMYSAFDTTFGCPGRFSPGQFDRMAHYLELDTFHYFARPNAYSPYVVPSSVAGTHSSNPSGGYDWTFRWITPYDGDNSLDRVYLSATPGAPPSCNIGNLTLTPAGSAVTQTVTQLADGTYEHEFVYHRNAVPSNCSLEFWVESDQHGSTAWSPPAHFSTPSGGGKGNISGARPASAELGIHPNPASGRASVSLALPRAETVSLGVYNLAGKRVANLHSGSLGAGAHEIVWDGRDESGATVASGIYMIRMVAGAEVVTRRLSLLQ